MMTLGMEWKSDKKETLKWNITIFKRNQKKLLNQHFFRTDFANTIAFLQIHIMTLFM